MKHPRGAMNRAIAWLPSRGDLPVPSSPAFGVVPDQRRKSTIRPYITTVRKLSQEELLELAALVGKRDTSGNSVIFGASVHWFGRIVKIMLNAAVKETFLPGLIHTGDHRAGIQTRLPAIRFRHLLGRCKRAGSGHCFFHYSYAARRHPQTAEHLTILAGGHPLSRCHGNTVS